MAHSNGQIGILRVFLSLLVAALASAAVMSASVLLIDIAEGRQSLAAIAGKGSPENVIFFHLALASVLSFVIAVPMALAGGYVIWFLFNELKWTRLWTSALAGASLGLAGFAVAITFFDMRQIPVLGPQPHLLALLCAGSGVVGAGAFWSMVFRKSSERPSLAAQMSDSDQFATGTR